MPEISVVLVSRRSRRFSIFSDDVCFSLIRRYFVIKWNRFLFFDIFIIFFRIGRQSLQFLEVLHQMVSFSVGKAYRREIVIETLLTLDPNLSLVAFFLSWNGVEIVLLTSAFVAGS